MHAFDVLGDPVRRRILELLAEGERAAGEVSAVVQEEFGISQPGVSQHLRVLRENGFATVRVDGPRRLYSVDPAPLREIDAWLQRYQPLWAQRLDALGTEFARGRRERRAEHGPGAVPDADFPAAKDPDVQSSATEDPNAKGVGRT